MAEVSVIGELNTVLRSDLLENAASKYLESHPASKGRWCLSRAQHDPSTCTYLHRKPEKAKAFVIIEGEPAPVPIAHLKDNRGLANVLTSELRFGYWCTTRGPHDEANCKSLHLGEVPDDKTVTVKGEEAPVKVSHLLFNSAVSYLLTHPDTEGVWCNNKVVHDMPSCRFVHRRVDDNPRIVRVDSEKFPVAVSQLIENSALKYLLDNPQCSGRWCVRNSPHDISECTYLHRRRTAVTVDGQSVGVLELVPNRGLKYLLEHAEASGHWCKGRHDAEHPIETCRFIHAKKDSDAGGTYGMGMMGGRGAGAGGPGAYGRGGGMGAAYGPPRDDHQHHHNQQQYPQSFMGQVAPPPPHGPPATTMGGAPFGQNPAAMHPTHQGMRPQAAGGAGFPPGAPGIPSPQQQQQQQRAGQVPAGYPPHSAVSRPPTTTTTNIFGNPEPTGQHHHQQAQRLPAPAAAAPAAAGMFGAPGATAAAQYAAAAGLGGLPLMPLAGVGPAAAMGHPHGAYTQAAPQPHHQQQGPFSAPQPQQQQQQQQHQSRQQQQQQYPPQQQQRQGGGQQYGSGGGHPQPYGAPPAPYQQHSSSQQQQQQPRQARPLTEEELNKSVNVEGETIPAQLLLLNPGLVYLVSNHGSMGKFCTRTADPNHLREQCTFIHRK